MHPFLSLHRTIALAILAVLASIACAAEPPARYHDPQLAFSVSIPDGFREEPSVKAAIKDCRFAAVRDEPDGGRTFFIIESLGGTIRHDIPDASKIPGFKGKLLGFQWKGLHLTGAEVPEPTGGAEFINYNIQVPTTPEALLLRIYGPKAAAPELLQIARTALASIEADTNWKDDLLTSGQSPNPTAMIVGIVGGIAVILILAMVVSRRLPRGVLLVVFIMIWFLGQSLRTPTRSGRLLSGAVTMLGSAGVLLGIVDACRSRKPKPGAAPLAAATSGTAGPGDGPTAAPSPADPESPKL